MPGGEQGFQAATWRTILPRVCFPSIIPWTLAASARGKMADTCGLTVPLSTREAISVRVLPMGGLVEARNALKAKPGCAGLVCDKAAYAESPRRQPD